MDLVIKKQRSVYYQFVPKRVPISRFCFVKTITLQIVNYRCSSVRFPLIHKYIIFGKRLCFIFLDKSQVNFEWVCPFFRYPCSPAFDMFEIRGVICPTYHHVTITLPGHSTLTTFRDRP